MLQPSSPANEEARLRSLRSLEILDTAPEERFDRITRLASLAFNVPISLVSLVDVDRQWFKSRHGLDASETGRDISFCGHAILSDDQLVVEDALNDSRFHDNPLVVGEPYIRFYAGTPLRDEAGHKLGTLCLIDRVPHTFTADHRALLREFGEMAQTELISIAREEIIGQRDEIRLLHESVFAVMHGAVMVLDANGEVISANESAKKMVDRQFRADKSVQDWQIDRVDLHGNSIPFEDRPLPFTLSTGQPVTGRVMGFPEESGETRWLEINTQPLMAPGETKPYAVVLSMDDITERLNLERLKTQFVSMVSHELRTPLTAINGSLSLLNSGALGQMSEKATRMLEVAHCNTERLVRLVNDILDLQRMESGAGELRLGPCSDVSLFDEVVGLMEPLATQAGVGLSVDAAGLSLDGDQDALMQTLSNLVGNAIKFSDSGGQIVVSSRPVGDVVQFSVADEGRGIPSDKLSSIFGRFQQVEASDSRAKGGTGLGLAICKQIVEQHGGQIWVESTLGVGSEFIFTIPVVSAAEATADPPTTTDEQRQKASAQ